MWRTLPFDPYQHLPVRPEPGEYLAQDNKGVPMHQDTSSPRGLRSGAIVVVTVVTVGLALALAATASAQAGFQATAKGIGPKPKPCATGDFICGSATTNYGDATWTFNPTTETRPPPGAHCGSYAATVTFALDDASNSTLVLDDNGTICPPPGNSLSAPGGLKSYGNPFYLTGSWTVETATGEFGSIPLGTQGTDALHVAGALASGTYMTSE